MELVSPRFGNLITGLLDAPLMLVATIALKGGGTIDRLKSRPDVSLYQISWENREDLVGEIEAAVRTALARPI